MRSAKIQSVVGIQYGFVAKLAVFKEHHGGCFVTKLWSGEITVLRNFGGGTNPDTLFIQNKFQV